MDEISTSRDGQLAARVAITSSASASLISTQVMPNRSRPAFTAGRARIGFSASPSAGRFAL
jgi:hypothetical protein